MKKTAHLTPGEFELMEILWPLGEASVKEVWQRVDPARGLAYTTVMTVLEKMFRKGMLTQRKKGKAYLYASTLSREQALREVFDHVCQTYFNGSQAGMVDFVNRHFVQSRADQAVPIALEAAQGRESGPPEGAKGGSDTPPF